MNIPSPHRNVLLTCHRLMTLACTMGLLWLPWQQAVALTVSMEYYHHNHQGSLLEVYDGATNKRLLSQAWSPWGERQVLHTVTSGDQRSAGNLLTQGLPAHMGYTGHKQLLATGLTFAGDTRLYDARLKRFLNSDDRTTGSIRGQNRYSYAYNNPMTYIDPDGRAPRTILSTSGSVNLLSIWQHRGDILRQFTTARANFRNMLSSGVLLNNVAEAYKFWYVAHDYLQIIAATKIQTEIRRLWTQRKYIMLRNFNHLRTNQFFSNVGAFYNEYRRLNPVVGMGLNLRNELRQHHRQLYTSNKEDRIVTALHTAWLEHSKRATLANNYLSRIIEGHYQHNSNADNLNAYYNSLNFRLLSNERYQLIDQAYVQSSIFHALRNVFPTEFTKFMHADFHQSQHHIEAGLLSIDLEFYTLEDFLPTALEFCDKPTQQFLCD